MIIIRAYNIIRIILLYGFRLMGTLRLSLEIMSPALHIS